MGWAGLEPATNALKGRCSTIELPTRAELFVLVQLVERRKPLHDREKIAQRILRTREFENAQPGGGSALPVVHRIVTGM